MQDSYYKILKLIKSDDIVDIFDSSVIAINFYNEAYLSFESLRLLNKYGESTRRFFLLTNTLCGEMENIYFNYFQGYNEQLFMDGLNLMRETIIIFRENYDKMKKRNLNNKELVNRVLYLINHTMKLIDSIII